MILRTPSPIIPYQNAPAWPPSNIGNIVPATPQPEQLNWPTYIGNVAKIIPNVLPILPTTNTPTTLLPPTTNTPTLQPNQGFIIPMPNAPFWKNYNKESDAPSPPLPSDFPTQIPSKPPPPPTTVPTTQPNDAPIFSQAPVDEIMDAPQAPWSMPPTTLDPVQQPSQQPSTFPSPIADQQPVLGPIFDPPPFLDVQRQPSQRPSDVPSTFPTFGQPSMVPSTFPTFGRPSMVPSEVPTTFPTFGRPSMVPSKVPTITITGGPTTFPSAMPSPSPSDVPSPSPSDVPSPSPIIPTRNPNIMNPNAPFWDSPAASPSAPFWSSPFGQVKNRPSPSPTTSSPTKLPTEIPTTSLPTKLPTTDIPTLIPTLTPTTKAPTDSPTTSSPTKVPTKAATNVPTASPTTTSPTKKESVEPSTPPTPVPSPEPSWVPSVLPTSSPSILPTPTPSILPSPSPSLFPTPSPSSIPSSFPSTAVPSVLPSLEPSTAIPTPLPSQIPTEPICPDNLGDRLSHGTDENNNAVVVDPYPPIEFSAVPKGTDDSVSLFVLGNIDIVKGVEIEGKIVTIDGSFTIHKDSGFKSLVRAGWGSHMIPSNGTDVVIIGKDIIFDVTENITFMHPRHGNIVYKGIFTGTVPQEVSEITQNDDDNPLPANNDNNNGESYIYQDIDYDMTEWVDAMEEIRIKGKYWGTNLTTNCITDGIDTNTITFKAAENNNDTIQVCHIRCTDLTFYVGRHIQFDASLVNKTILINVQASPVDEKCNICNLADFIDTQGNGQFQFSTSLTQNILWNFYNAVEVSLGCTCTSNTALGEWQGSILVPSVGSTFSNCMPGHSGRIIIHGNMIQNKEGSELHNYPFLPPEPLPCPPSE